MKRGCERVLFLRGRLKRVRRLKPQRRKPSPPTRTQANEGFLSPASAGCVRVAATFVAKAAFKTYSERCPNFSSQFCNPQHSLAYYQG